MPAPEGSQGIAINRLNILNNLIEQMKQMNQTQLMADTAAVIDAFASSDISTERLDALINIAGNQIRGAMENQGMSYTFPIPESGLVFNFTA